VLDPAEVKKEMERAKRERSYARMSQGGREGGREGSVDVGREGGMEEGREGGKDIKVSSWNDEGDGEDYLRDSKTGKTFRTSSGVAGRRVKIDEREGGRVGGREGRRDDDSERKNLSATTPSYRPSSSSSTRPQSARPQSAKGTSRS